MLGNPDILYVGTASSGLYKSTNGGVTFDSIFDTGNTLSIGAIAVRPDDPNVVYVGTGEGAVRNSISFGDGIYKSTDGGKSWTHLGSKDSERFSRIIIHSKNPRIVFAAAMGHTFGPNAERGLYRTQDDGRTWQRVLFVNETTGASDVAIDPHDPNIVYAGMYDYLRKPWHFRSGGPGSGLYRSTDGGITWTKLTDPALRNGLPGARLIGRVGVAISPSNPAIVYALIESQEDGQLWRSDDRGRSWRMVNNERRINNRPFYYTQVRVDPVDPERVYTLAGSFNVSTDGLVPRSTKDRADGMPHSGGDRRDSRHGRGARRARRGGTQSSASGGDSCRTARAQADRLGLVWRCARSPARQSCRPCELAHYSGGELHGSPNRGADGVDREVQQPNRCAAEPAQRFKERKPLPRLTLNPESRPLTTEKEADPAGEEKWDRAGLCAPRSSRSGLVPGRAILGRR